MTPPRSPESRLALAHDALRRFEEMVRENKPTVELFRCNAEALVEELALRHEHAIALKDLLCLREKQYQARCQGTVRDTKLEGEIMAARVRLEEIEMRLGIKKEKP